MPTSWTNEGNSTVTTQGNALTCTTLTATGTLSANGNISSSGEITAVNMTASGNVVINGDLTIGGGDINFTSDDFIMTSKGNITFFLDTNNDETGQKFAFWNYLTEIATLNESGDLQIDGDLTLGGEEIKSNGGQTCITVSGTATTTAGNLKATGYFAANNATPAAAPDWTVSNKTGTSRALDANGTLADIGDRLAQLVDDLISIGLLQ